MSSGGTFALTALVRKSDDLLLYSVFLISKILMSFLVEEKNLKRWLWT